MVVINNFDLERVILAKKCAEALGLKEIPSILYEFGVNVSELPEDTKAKISGSIPESSLLSMGLVYKYNGTLTFINSNGHTMVVPSCNVIENLLKECGYLICDYGKSVPPMENSAQDSYSYKRELEKYRKKYTLPQELAEQIYRQENTAYSSSFSDEYAYDVFDRKYYRGGLIGAEDSRAIAEVSDLRSKVIRILLSFHNGTPDLSHNALNVLTIEDYLLYVKEHNILCDKIYYADNGLFKVFYREQLDARARKEKAAALAARPTISGLNANGDLTTDPNQIVSHETVINPGNPKR
ncbi:MAG: hypothetical protein E7161_03130 [Firmicutes bacterium]|nr:hypothetical protein [Bacillota bacterium]